MADFDIALAKVLRREGGYANDPNDRGGETYKGISRKAHPTNRMWVLIDKYKEQYGGANTKFKQALAKDQEITNCVRVIYKTSYWNPFKLDDLYHQLVAEQVFDDAVNRGVAAACKLLSSVLHIKYTTKPTEELINALRKF